MNIYSMHLKMTAVYFNNAQMPLNPSSRNNQDTVDPWDLVNYSPTMTETTTGSNMLRLLFSCNLLQFLART